MDCDMFSPNAIQISSLEGGGSGRLSINSSAVLVRKSGGERHLSIPRKLKAIDKPAKHVVVWRGNVTIRANQRWL
jgi:hypothetical protein